MYMFIFHVYCVSVVPVACCDSSLLTSSSWFGKLESSGWLGHVERILKTAKHIVFSMHQESKRCDHH